MAMEREGELDGVMEGAVCSSGSSRGSQGKAVCLRASALAAPCPQQPTLLFPGHGRHGHLSIKLAVCLTMPRLSPPNEESS